MRMQDRTGEHQAKASLDRLLDFLEDSVFVIDKDFYVVTCNRQAQQAFSLEFSAPSSGCKRGVWPGLECFRVFHKRDRACPGCPLGLPHTASEGMRQTFRVKRGTSPCQWFEETIRTFNRSDLGFEGALLQVRDVSHHKNTEMLLREEVRWRRMLMAHSRDGIVVLDEQGKLIEANRQFARMLGYSPREVRHLYVWNWDAMHSRERLLQMVQSVDISGDRFETLHRRKDGSLYAAEITTNGVTLKGRRYVLCICRDITEKKLLQEQIRELAIRDPLTNLYNRRFIFERLEQLGADFQRGATNFAVALFDVDYFKSVNDLYGHQTGDVVLREFSQLLTGTVRQSDLVGRYGGEEFIVIATIENPGDTKIMIDRILSRVRAHPFFVNGHTIRITASCGIAESFEFGDDDFSAEAMLTMADHRLYPAKEGGRDQVIGPEPFAAQAPLFCNG